VAYKLSSQKTPGKAHLPDPNSIDWGKIAAVFILFGLLGLLTAWIYSMETEKVVNASFYPAESNGGSAEIGPINVRKHNETYTIGIGAALQSQSWASIEGEVLNAQKQYLFSFGKELSYYSGRDFEGSWSERVDSYEMNVTFPQPGTYYLKFSTESDRVPPEVKVRVSKKAGSSLPHLWFGGIALVIGIVMTLSSKGRFKKIIASMED
jgi:hypothetical protein